MGNDKMLFKKMGVALGIVTGRSLTGPIEVSVDLTRKCTAGCIMCWYWSPLLEQRPSAEWADQQLDYELFLRLLKDFKKLHVKRIVFGGQGEPLLYPRITEVIDATKKAGIETVLITNGVYLNEKKIKEIFDLRVDHVDFSIHAATSQTYQKIHPGLKEGTFERIKQAIALLAGLKKKFNRKIPTVTLIDAIFNLNYHETVKMVELAKELGAEAVGFKRADIIPETRCLLLNNAQMDELKKLLKEAKEKAVELGVDTSIDFYEKYIMAGLTTGDYTSGYYSRVPCYVGWVSSRILSDGSVIPCCGCYDVILGNIRNSSFAKIWNSKEYREFRKKSINIWKNQNLAQECKCSSCIDFEFNLRIYQKLHPIKTRKLHNHGFHGLTQKHHSERS